MTIFKHKEGHMGYYNDYVPIYNQFLPEEWEAEELKNKHICSFERFIDIKMLDGWKVLVDMKSILDKRQLSFYKKGDKIIWGCERTGENFNTTIGTEYFDYYIQQPEDWKERRTYANDSTMCWRHYKKPNKQKFNIIGYQAKNLNLEIKCECCKVVRNIKYFTDDTSTECIECEYELAHT